MPEPAPPASSDGAVVGNVTQNAVADQAASRATNATVEFKLAPEQTFKARPDLQAAVLFVDNNFTVVEDQLEAKVKGDAKDRWSWGTLKKISDEDRKSSVASTNDEWADKFMQWNDTMAQNAEYQHALDSIYHALGINEVTAQTVQEFIGKYSNNGNEGLEAFKNDIIKLGKLDESSLSLVKGIAVRLFGNKVMGEVMTQIVAFEDTVAQAGTDGQKQGEIIAGLKEAAASPSKQTQDDIEEMRQMLTGNTKPEDQPQDSNTSQNADDDDKSPPADADGKPKSGEASMRELPDHAFVLSAGVGHPDQSLAGDPHSIGGDYWFTYADINPPAERVTQRGRLRIVMDTATKGGDSSATQAFAHAFTKYYYERPEFSDPQDQAMWAFKMARQDVGADRLHSTLAYTITTDDRGIYGGGIGNSTAIAVAEGNHAAYLYDPRGQSHIALLDKSDDRTVEVSELSAEDQQLFNTNRAAFEAKYKDRYEVVSPTVLIASGGDLKQSARVELGKGYAVMHTDGVKVADYSAAGLEQALKALAAVTGEKDDSVVLLFNDLPMPAQTQTGAPQSPSSGPA